MNKAELAVGISANSGHKNTIEISIDKLPHKFTLFENISFTFFSLFFKKEFISHVKHFVSKQKLNGIKSKMDSTIRDIKFKVDSNFSYNPVLTTPEVQEKYDDAGKKYIEFINELLEPSTKQNNEGNVDVNSLKSRDDDASKTQTTANAPKE